jgi:hypothetical protein
MSKQIQHIIPKHMTGGIYDNSPDNLTPKISSELHATLQYNPKNKYQTIHPYRTFIWI